MYICSTQHVAHIWLGGNSCSLGFIMKNIAWRMHMHKFVRRPCSLSRGQFLVACTMFSDIGHSPRTQDIDYLLSRVCLSVLWPISLL